MEVAGGQHSQGLAELAHGSVVEGAGCHYFNGMLELVVGPLACVGNWNIPYPRRRSIS